MASEETPDSGERLEQLERAIAVLEAFDRDHPALTLSEVAALAGTSRASARRILLTFKALGHVKSDGRYFSLAPKVLNLGWNYFASLGVDEIAKPLMTELVREIDESCSMATLDLPDIVYVARVHTRHIMTIAGGVGSRLPAHATAAGHVLLAGLADEHLDEYLESAPLTAHTARTVTDPARFREDIAEVRRRGWALVDQQLEIGLRAVSAPVFDSTGHTAAALSVSSNSARTSLADLRNRCLPRLREVARTISTTLARTNRRGTAS
ncbi:helix-turn-helix domain-containing protein [Amycolatopsis acidicola]|uniref:Helix-turn-helix domain-containing protein n=1 Tax=Amycolatopsis acidicola TaxID=2596893 RepID=A0A5N0V366_9PSEU|nr:IclR family transcriptional regulator C-terminal domain-containing protein [Amycolatopsis acidicola]KAA9160897.1 helix-turn-helix domain-containing protein [Amycolatopsis acidicola]